MQTSLFHSPAESAETPVASVWHEINLSVDRSFWLIGTQEVDPARTTGEQSEVGKHDRTSKTRTALSVS